MFIKYKKIVGMPLVFSLPFCLLLPDGDYQVKVDKDEIVTLKLTKVIPKIFDERLPYRGFLKGELENIATLWAMNEKGPIGWINVSDLSNLVDTVYVTKYKTTDGKEVIPVIEPSIIEKDVDVYQDSNINHERFPQSFKQDKLSPESINQIISERQGYGRQLVINAEVKNDPVGRFRYTKVTYNSAKVNENLEEQFKEAIGAVNKLIKKYRSITGDYWITKVREEDIFTYKGVENDPFDFSTVAKGFVKTRSDHNKATVDNLRESLVAEEGPGFPFFDLFLDAQNAFEQANYDLAIIYSVTA